MALVASGRVTVEGGPIAPARAWRNPRALLVFVVTALAVSAAHLQYMHLPYYWDEAGHFIPAALDIFRQGEWIPSSTVPNIHPPAIPAYVSLAWKVAGDSVVTIRVAMLLLAALCLWATWLLGTELLPEKRRAGWFAVLVLFVSPLFFMQSMLAQLDLPATAFTVLALYSFLRGRIALSTSICVVLVLVKETGVAVPRSPAIPPSVERSHLVCVPGVGVGGLGCRPRTSDRPLGRKRGIRGLQSVVFLKTSSLARFSSPPPLLPDVCRYALGWRGGSNIRVEHARIIS